MTAVRIWFLWGLFLLSGLRAEAQRTYRPSSVLASGNWFRISAGKMGIYKVDIPFLNGLGLSGNSFPSSAIRLFGNGGGMLPEGNPFPRTDDLQELAIYVADGGDGQLNGNDYFLFYAPGPDSWQKDSVNRRFTHIKNIYTDKTSYFITVGGAGKRITQAAPAPAPVVQVSSFDYRFFHELDTVNFLSSGKEWYGEEMSNIPGRTVTRSFVHNIPGLVTGLPVTLVSELAARSVGSSSRFDISLNNQLVQSLSIPAVSGGQYDLFARSVRQPVTAISGQPGVNLTYTYLPGSLNAQGWLNWFELFARRNLALNGNETLFFRDWTSVGNSTAEFIISGSAAATQVWDITNPQTPELVNSTFSGNETRFVREAMRLREYVAFGSGFLTPAAENRVANQDLHNSRPVDYIIVTHDDLLVQAKRLADFHQQKNNLRVVVVTAGQIYNEFAGGNPDPVAIRDFVKMYYDKAGAVVADKPRYLLLFGDASYDYKDRLRPNTNLVPAWENNFSLDPLATYASDDFYGFLDDNDDINNGLVLNLLDIGIGRVPAKNAAEAQQFVDKVIQYYNAESLGPWRNNHTFIADDEDQNLHLQDAELINGTAAVAAPVFNQQKIYLDAFRQESGSGGSRYPQANEAISNQVFNGTLIWNYNGHGGSARLAEETILDQETVNGWKNKNRLPLFITATCDFAPYENPAINSIGENILLRAETGAIALMTTTRVVFAFSNRVMNTNYLREALTPDAAGKHKSLGDAVKAAKNFTYQTSGDVANNRKFTLLGDPALTLGFPQMKVKTTAINGLPVPANTDTLRATDKITIEGEVTDGSGVLLNNFNGTVYPVLFDKPQTVNTLANDPGSLVTGFVTQGNTLFKGKASVTNGRFQFSFRMPRDINYQFGAGRLSLYAENGTTDANGLFNGFLVGGIGDNAADDREGPEIKAWLNDEKFVNGGITNPAPVLLVKLADSSGINTAGTGIGHDLVATLDNDNRRFFVLNDFYTTELDDYQQGQIRFQLPELEPGPHTLTIKAWDVLNNSNETILTFVVADNNELVIDHVLNYPNPFTTKTQFWFGHNQPGRDLTVKVQIFTVAGNIVKTIKHTINTPGNRSCEVEWDGRDDYGRRIGRGVYIYKLSVIVPGLGKKEIVEKLVIL